MKVLKSFCVAFLKVCSKMEGSGNVMYLSLPNTAESEAL